MKRMGGQTDVRVQGENGGDRAASAFVMGFVQIGEDSRFRIPDFGLAVKSAFGQRGTVLLLVLLAAALRLGGLDGRDLWIDEAFSVWMAGHAPGRMFETAATLDHHPPLYYLLLRGWVALVGEREFGVRLLSAGLGVASVPLFFAMGRALLGPGRALAATGLLVISPFHVAYAQEARMYTLLGFTALLALWCALVIVRRPPRTIRDGLVAGGRLAVAQALVMWSHNTAALLFPLALNVAVWGGWWATRRGGATGARAPAWNWIFGQVGAFLLWALWLPGFVRQARAVDARFWVEMPGVAELWLALQSFTIGHPPAWWGWGGGWIGLSGVLAGWGLWSLRRRPAVAIGLASLWLVGPVTALLVSLRRPVFLESTLIWTTFAFFLVLAAGVESVARGVGASRWWEGEVVLPRVARGVLLGLLGLGMVGGLWGFYAGGPREAWREAAAAVQQEAVAGDLILFQAAWAQLPFLYYADYDQGEPGDALAHGVAWGGIPGDLFEQGELEPEMRAEDVPRLLARIEGHERVWLVYSHVAYSDPQGLAVAALEGALRTTYFREFPGVKVYRFER